MFSRRLLQMNIKDNKHIGCIPYLSLLILSALSLRYISIGAGILLYVSLHIVYLLFRKERVPLLTWLFLSLSFLIPTVLVLLAKSNSAFYILAGNGLMRGHLPRFDTMFMPYGGFTFSILCLGSIYQKTSFYDIGFSKGGFGFYLVGTVGIVLIIMTYYAVITKS